MLRSVAECKAVMNAPSAHCNIFNFFFPFLEANRSRVGSSIDRFAPGKAAEAASTTSAAAEAQSSLADRRDLKKVPSELIS